MPVSRLAEAVKGVPLCTLCVVALCCGVYLAIFLLGLPMTDYSIMARNVLYLGEWYRVVTAAYVHANIMHIGFNMMSVLAIGAGLESDMGTLALTAVIMWSVLLVGGLYVLVQRALVDITGIEHAADHLVQQAVGFSGVIFTLAVMECQRSTEPYRTLMGMLTVPTRLYPWVLMVVLQIMMKEVSLLGHLGGAVVGMLHAYGLTAPLLPSQDTLREMEQWPGVRHAIALCPNFKPCPPPAAGTGEAASIAGLCKGMFGLVTYLLTAVWWVLSTVLHIAGLYTPASAPPQNGGWERVPTQDGDMELGHR